MSKQLQITISNGRYPLLRRTYLPDVKQIFRKLTRKNSDNGNNDTRQSTAYAPSEIAPSVLSSEIDGADYNWEGTQTTKYGEDCSTTYTTDELGSVTLSDAVYSAGRLGKGLLTAQEEQELGNLIQFSKLADERISACNELVARNHALAKAVGVTTWDYISKMYPQLKSVIDVDDCIQIASLGLLEAASKYVPVFNSEPVRFSSYAYKIARGRVFDEVRKILWIPRPSYERIREINNARDELRVQLRHEPISEEICKATSLTMEQYWSAMEDASRRIISLNRPFINEDESDGHASDCLSDYIPGNPDQEPQNIVAENERLVGLQQALTRLTERERHVLSLYYERELTMKEIAPLLGVSEARVCQLHRRALERMRNIMGDLQPLNDRPYGHTVGYERSKSSSGSFQSYGLTSREIQILEMVARDYSNRQIADELKVSKRAVKNHKHRIKTKIRLHYFTES